MIPRCRHGSVSMMVLFTLIFSSFIIDSAVDGVPTRAHLDVAVSDISLTGLQEDRFFPGDTVDIVVSVGHDNDPLPSDTPIGIIHGLQLQMTIDNSIDNVTTIIRNINSVPLNYSVDRNGTYNPMLVQFRWIANFSFETDVNFEALLVIADDDTTNNGYGVGPVSFDHIRSDPFIWEEGQKVRDYCSPSPHLVKVGGIVNIPFELQNNDGEVDTFEFVVLSFSQGWNVSLGGPYTVYPNDAVEVEMFVVVSSDPLEALADEDHHIVVQLRSIYEPNRTYSQQNVHTFRFEVRIYASAEVFPESDNVYLKPGDAHQVYYWLKNTGNGEDDYVLTVNIDDEHIRKGWKAAFESGTRQPTVKPGSDFRVILRVTVPKDSPLNYVVIQTMTCRSLNAEYEILSDPCTLIADVRHAARIEEFDNPFDVVPGESNEIAFNFSNEGNSKDPSLCLFVSYKPKGWTIVIDQSPLTATGGIGPKTTVYLQMSVFVEETTVASSKGNLPFIVIQARGGTNNHLLDEERYYFRIPLIHKVELTCGLDRVVGSPGEEIQLNFTLKNRGGWLDTFNVSIEGIEMTFSPHPSWEELAPNETFRFRASFMIPYDWPADADPSTPWPVNGTLFDPYSIKLRARSQNETEMNSSMVEHPIELFILPRCSLEMQVIDGPIWKVPYDHDQSRTFLVEVHNTGNAICNMEISLKTTYPWVDVIGDPVILGYDETRYIPIYLNYRAFDMDEYDNPLFDLNITVEGVSGELLNFHHELNFGFLPYTYHIEMVEVIQPSWMMDGSFLIFFGDNQTFKVYVKREGQSMYLPDEMDGPYIVMYIDGVERTRMEIPQIPPSNKKSMEIGPIQMLFKGNHDVDFVIEGMGSESSDGVSNWSLVINVASPSKKRKDKDDGSIIPIIFGISALIIAVIMIAAGIFAYFRLIRKDEPDENYEQIGMGLQLKIK